MARKNSRMATRYVLISFTTVLLAGMVVGMILYTLASGEMTRREQENVRQKVMHLAQDLDAQHSAMQSVWSKISSEVYYRKSYLERNRYYDIDLLDSLVKFKGYTVLTDDYFFKFVEEDWVYKSSGGKSTFNVYMNSLGVSDVDGQLQVKVDAMHSFGVLTTPDPDVLLFVYPMQLGKGIGLVERAVLGFAVKTDALERRASLLVGELPGELSLRWGGREFAVLGEADGQPDLEIEVDSKGGQFQVVLRTEKRLIAANAPLRDNGILLLSVALSLVLVGLYMGYALYKPIGRLHRQYSAATGNDEIENIEIAFRDLIEKRQDAETRIRSQYRLIKMQFLKLLLSGDKQYGELLARPFVGIALPGPFYAVMAVRFAVGELPDAAEEEISDQVEELTDEDMHFYFSRTNDGDIYAVVMSLPDHESLVEAQDYVCTLLQEQQIEKVGLSPVFDDMRRFKDALGRAINRLERGDGRYLTDRDNMAVDETALKAVILAIQTGSEEAEDMLRSLVESIHDRLDSFLAERYLYDQILHRLLTEFADERAEKGAVLVERILKAAEYEEFLGLLLELARVLCEAEEDDDLDDEPIRSRKGKVDFEEVLSYMEKHFTDSDMSLDILAERFELSTRYISNLIKQGTGHTYKDYLIRLRMERAREILLEGDVTVTETCERVGYTHLPLFIKNFKRIIGCTPSTLLAEKEESEEDEYLS